MVPRHIFRAILNHSEPFALDLDKTPWRVNVRAQVIMGFVALGLGKGGLFVSTYLIAMAWLEPDRTVYAVACSVLTIVVMALGYIITFARIEAEIDPQKGVVHLTRRMPFYRSTVTTPLSSYQGILLKSKEDQDKRFTHTLVLSHPDEAPNVPLWHRHRPEPPMVEWAQYAEALETQQLQ